MFNLPTLVTITAPTCAGKNFLLESMVNSGFGRIVSTTDREARDGEVEGVHYFFISTAQSMLKEEKGLFAELVTYNGTRYGVTHEEMQLKLAAWSPPIVILEPNGVEIYRKYCGQHGFTMFSIYVEAQESIRLARLTERTANEIIMYARRTGGTPQGVHSIIGANNQRLKSIIENERSWNNTNRWDVIADGTNIEKALEQIAQGIKFRNSRSEIYK